MEDIVPKGATAIFAFTVIDTESMFNDKTALRFALKDHYDNYLFCEDTLTSTLTCENDQYAYLVELPSSLTKDLDLGPSNYFYDVTLLLNDEGDKKFPLLKLQSVIVTDTAGARK